MFLLEEFSSSLALRNLSKAKQLRIREITECSTRPAFVIRGARDYRRGGVRGRVLGQGTAMEGLCSGGRVRSEAAF